MDPKKLAQDMLQAVKDYVADAAAGLSARLSEMDEKIASVSKDTGALPELVDKARGMLEGHLEALVKALPPPKNGENVDPEAVRAMVADAVAKIPPPKDGEDFDPEILRTEVAKAVAALPQAKDGKDVDPKDVAEMVEKAVAAIPPAAPGKDADPELVKKLVADEVAKIPRQKGEPGDSVTVADLQPVLEMMFAKSLLDYERRFGETIAHAIKDIPPPKNGADGLSIEDLKVEHDGLGNVKMIFSRGEVRREFEIRVPCFRDRGVFREGEVYREGEGVTFGGSYWLSQRDNPEGRPGAIEGEKGKGNGHWRLAVNKGRDASKSDRQASPGGPVSYGGGGR